MTLVPRVIASWVTLAIAIAIGGVVTLAVIPQYLSETATLTLNAGILGYLITRHRSARLSPLASSAKVDLAALTRSMRSTE